MVAEVLVEIKAKSIDQTFSYLIPERFKEKAKIGIRVLVPFGKQKLEGFILNIKEKEEMELKEIIDLVDSEPVLNDDMLELGKFLKRRTLATLISCYQTMLPKALKAKKGCKINEKYISYIKLIDFDYVPKNEAQKDIIDLLLKEDKLKNEILKKSSLKTLIDKKVVEEYKVEVYRLEKDIKIEKNNIILNSEQKKVVDTVCNNLNEYQPFLLYGVTGSGKTEVYMHIMEEVLKNGKEIIVLVPEISLTPQIVEIFRKRFGNNVAIMHSSLNDGERYDEWRKVFRKEVQIVIGARSAIFAPFTNLGLIVVDEEHTNTYKQENNPRYNAIEVALYRAKKSNIPLILGSATPSIESFTKTKTGSYKLLTLKNRVNKMMPSIELIDMKEEIKKGNRIISEKLKKEINQCLEKKEQVIILLNRRGYSTVVTCHSCGESSICPKCDIPLTYHKKSNKMKCHYCNYEKIKPTICPKCQSEDIDEFGMGTEKLEQELNRLFNARIIRMDVDTTRKKSAHEDLINCFSNKEADILIGTQMIAKGLDFPNVTLVGVINGDASLNIPDFRSSERTFQLLTQVAGRSGRSSEKGTVIIQGFNIDHYSIVCTKNHDYLGFYNRELEIRKKLKYPPFINLTSIKIVSKDYQTVINEGNKISKYLKNNLKDTIILGPTFGNRSKINNYFYLQIILKYKKLDTVIECLQYINNHYTNNKVSIEIDINPLKV